jgi:hypothetical protein
MANDDSTAPAAQYNHRFKLRVGLATLLVLAPIWNFPLHYALAKLGAADLQWFLFWVYMPLAFEISGKVADRFALKSDAPATTAAPVLISHQTGE